MIRKKKQCGHLRCGETCRFGPKKKKRAVIRRQSIKRAEEYKLYYPAREKHLFEQKFCECGCGGYSVEIHHKKGKIGKLLYDKRYFMAVTRRCHRKITNNPVWAMEQGFTISRHKTEKNETSTSRVADQAYP